ncbi:hypothetical protein, partial [Saccharothrix sp.]|uniref:hypothetical protein n=1 Tax=Saccharothrix sp. TaxID=1873460 RepID=UPI002811E89B
ARRCPHGKALPARQGAARTARRCPHGKALPARQGAARTARRCPHGKALRARQGAARTAWRNCGWARSVPARRVRGFSGWAFASATVSGSLGHPTVAGA